jgi:hypothetical protein
MDKPAQLIFSRGLTDGSHTCRLEIDRAPNEGWRVRQEYDSQIVRQVTYGDWHRVELAMRGFAAQAAELVQRGWRIHH